MNHRIRVGLFVGTVVLILTIFVTLLVGVCGPIVPLIGGAVAGYFAVKQEAPGSKAEGGKIGAIAGAITGLMGFLGQILGGVLTLTFLPTLIDSLGNPKFLPAAGSDQVTYWLSGLGTTFCIGIGGILFGLITGYGAGYFSTNDRPNDTNLQLQ